MPEKKRLNPLFKILLCLFGIYMVIYCLSISGYYENKRHLQVTYTNEKIKEFEEDVKNGVEIDMKKYVDEHNKNYANVFTKTSDNIGQVISKIMGGGLDEAWKIIRTLF
jgi:hypothetical protein